MALPADADCFIHLTLGGVSVTGLVTQAEQDAIDSGVVADVVLRQVVAVHEDVGQEIHLGDVPCTFVGGEPSPFGPSRV